MKIFLLFLSCAGCFLNAAAQIGSLDASFGNGGIVNMPSLKVIPAPDHSLYVVFYSYDDLLITVKKTFSDGTIDVSYGIGGYSQEIEMSRFVDAALTNDGKIVLVGGVDYATEPHFDVEVCRLTLAGFRDPMFNGGHDIIYTASQLSYDEVLSMNLGGDKIFLLTNSVSAAEGFTIYNVLIVDDSGNVGAKGLTSYFVEDDHHVYEYSLGIQGTRLFVATNIYNAGNSLYPYEYSLAGFDMEKVVNLDRTFLTPPLVVQGQGDKILIAGNNYNSITGVHGIAIARYNNDGSPDNSFNGNGMLVIDFGEGITVTPKSIAIHGDKIIVGGNVTNSTTHNTQFALMRLNNDGTLDVSFDSDGKQTTDLGGPGFSMQQLKIYENRLFVFGGSVVAAYILEDDNNNPITLSCPAAKTVQTDAGLCTALISEIGPFTNSSPDDTKVNYTLTGATTANGVGNVSGLAFKKGVTMVTYSVIDDPAKTCSFNIIVEDKEVPLITNVSVTPAVLWPPNHKMKDVTVNYAVTDNCAGVITDLSVKSNEPQTGNGKDDLPFDFQVIDAHHVKLRAERNGNGIGRIYAITITAKDASGNEAKQYAVVTVPHSQGKHRQSFDDGEKAEGLQVKVLPNPSRNYFTLQTSSRSNIPIILQVTNAVGSTIETRTGLAANGKVEVGSDYSDGFYIAELMQGTQKVLVKLVKLR